MARTCDIEVYIPSIDIYKEVPEVLQPFMGGLKTLKPIKQTYIF